MGFRLRPLSIWHVWALSAMDSPYVCGGKYTVDDICNCLMICSQTRESFAALSAGGLHVALKGEIGAAYIEADKDARAQAEAQLAQYIADCTVFPEFWEKEKTDAVKDRLRCPPEWHIVSAILSMRICQTEAEAWDYPIARARCWQAVDGERNGGRDYLDARDRADLKLAAEMEAANHE